MTADRQLPDEIIARIISRLRSVQPDLEAVLLCGSFARGDSDLFSDIDILALSEDEPECANRTWFEVAGTGERFHVSVGVEALASFQDDEPGAADWALGFATVDSVRVLWVTPRGHAVVGDDPSEFMPPAEPALEDFTELYMKLRRASGQGDTVLLRWAARALAEYSAGLVRPFNTHVVVASAAGAIAAALAFQHCPAHYVEDFEVCWGLRPAGDAEVFTAATRMQQDLLDWLRARLTGLKFEHDDAYALLLDGSLQAYLSA